MATDLKEFLIPNINFGVQYNYRYSPLYNGRLQGLKKIIFEQVFSRSGRMTKSATECRPCAAERLEYKIIEKAMKVIFGY